MKLWSHFCHFLTKRRTGDRVPRGRFNRFSTTSPRIAAGDSVFSSKFRKVVKAGGPWFESGQRTFVKLDKFNIKFRFSGLFVAITYFLMQKGTKKIRKTKFYDEFMKF